MSTDVAMTQLLQWAGCVTGVLGSAMLAWRSRWSGWGFVVYLVSNACWIAFGLLAQASGLVVMQCIFTVTSAVGVWRWLLMPRRACGQVPRGRKMRPLLCSTVSVGRDCCTLCSTQQRQASVKRWTSNEV